MIYLDTSCLLKLLLEEVESEAVRLQVARESDVIVSALAELETRVQLRAGWLAGQYRERRYRAYVERLHVFRETDPFRFRPLAGSLFETALRQDRDARRIHCRTLDRLHLAAMEELGVRRLMTTDVAEAAGARALGFQVVNPGQRWRRDRSAKMPHGARGPLPRAMTTAPARFKLLATDLDGTLLDRDGAIHERDRQAIVELQRRGVAVTIVTGRMYSGTRDVAQSLRLDGPVGCLDGSAIVAVREDRHLVARTLTEEAGRVLQAALAGGNPAVFVLGRDEIFHDARGVPFAQYLRGWTPRITPVEDVTAATHWDARAGVAGVIAVGTKEEIDALVKDLAPAAGLVAPVAFPVRRDAVAGHWAMMVRHAGATKGSALEWIAAHHGVDMREVVAVGDWQNDVPMFRVAGRSFAMAHASDEVKAAASEHLRADVTTGGGVAEAAERAGLL